MKTIFLGLGSNVGDKEKNIKHAVNLLSEKINNVKLAKIYKSKPYGFKNQDYFLNTALMGLTDLSPDELFDFVKKVENKVGRKKRFHWGPREIDIDILFYEDLIYETDFLVIPHPRIQERDFVLKPLCDLNPDLIHPVLKKTVKELLDELDEFYIEEY